MLLLTASGHFLFEKGMARMIPGFIPLKRELVWLTGVVEILAAIELQLTQFKTLTGWLLILFFVLVLPANIYAALHQIDCQKGTFNGVGLIYLWFRIPLQLFFIVWTYFSSIRL